jgi:hypothetical protein
VPHEKHQQITGFSAKFVIIGFTFERKSVTGNPFEYEELRSEK